MKHSELRAIVHNVADSIASGCSLLLGFYELKPFEDAAKSDSGAMEADFLSGTVAESASWMLKQAVARCPDIIAVLCSDAGGSVSELAEARATFWSDQLPNRFAVTIVDRTGRRSVTEYAGIPANA